MFNQERVQTFQMKPSIIKTEIDSVSYVTPFWFKGLVSYFFFKSFLGSHKMYVCEIYIFLIFLMISYSLISIADM